MFQKDRGNEWVVALNIDEVYITTLYIPDKGIMCNYELIKYDGDSHYVIVPCIYSTRPNIPIQELITATKTLFEKIGIKFTVTPVSNEIANKIICDEDMFAY